MTADFGIISGEFPPMPGGVSDYSRGLRDALRDRGYSVTVAAPSDDADIRLSFDPPSVRQLLGRSGVARRWLIQWVPHAYGWRSLNPTVPAWALVNRDPVWTMFHEVALPFLGMEKLAWNAAASAHRGFAAALVCASQRVFVSTPAWRTRHAILRRAEWLPVPSNLERAAAETCSLAVDDDYIVHFGTYAAVSDCLVQVLRQVGHARPGTNVVLVGRGSTNFASKVSVSGLHLTPTGELSAGAVRTLLTRARLALQPYPDGVTTRRGTAMAALAAGCPLLTNLGPLSEPFWQSTRSAYVVDRVSDLAEAAVSLLSHHSERERLAERGGVLYHQAFSMERTVDRLVSAPDPDWQVRE